MSEVIVVDLFLALRVALVGGILLFLPRIVRGGLLSGVYVGQHAEDAAHELRVEWTRGCLVVMAASLTVGFAISSAASPLAGNLTGTAVLLLGALILYFRVHAEAVRLAPAEASRDIERVTAILDTGTDRVRVFTIVVAFACAALAVAVETYALIGYRAMPDLVPEWGGLIGGASGLTRKSLVAVMVVPTLNIVFTPFLAVLAAMTATAKRSPRTGSARRSLDAQISFRAANAVLFSVNSMLLCILLSLILVQIVRYGLSRTSSRGAGLWWFAGVVIVYMAGSLFWLMRHFGQGGARLEGDTHDAPLGGGLADDRKWVAGLFYVDRDDPSIMVEKRFGIGYTLNYGNRIALTMVATVLTLGILAIVVTLIDVVS
jgi:uncharacterized membrane protein